MTPDEPDAYSCRFCGRAYSCRNFNCQCGKMECGHGWRTGGEMRNECGPCLYELLDLYKAVGELLASAIEIPAHASDKWSKVMTAHKNVTRGSGEKAGTPE